MYKKITWSPVEDEYLLKNKKKALNQLCISLAKSRAAIQKRLKELSGEIPVASRPTNPRTNIGKRKDLGGLFLRSSWEANLFRLLLLDKNIIKIEYEPVDFTFWQFGVKKGTVSYTPDFKITYQDGEYNFIEVKGGFLRPGDKTKIRRFQKYYPEEFAKLVAVTPGLKSKTAMFFQSVGVEIKWIYPELNRQFKNVVPNWE